MNKRQCCGQPNAPNEDISPNIVFIFGDGMDYGDLTGYKKDRY